MYKLVKVPLSSIGSTNELLINIGHILRNHFKVPRNESPGSKARSADLTRPKEGNKRNVKTPVKTRTLHLSEP
jgi:hypothetical protein